MRELSQTEQQTASEIEDAIKTALESRTYDDWADLLHTDRSTFSPIKNNHAKRIAQILAVDGMKVIKSRLKVCPDGFVPVCKKLRAREMEMAAFGEILHAQIESEDNEYIDKELFDELLKVIRNRRPSK